jgi:alkaline phosphatase D
MTKLLSAIFFLFSSLIFIESGAQSLHTQRNIDFVSGVPDSDLAPFYHGVASGDPLEDRVIIWTRVTPEGVEESIEGTWRMALDTGMSEIVSSGVFETYLERDFTVKIDADGLQPNTCYYYDFETDGKYSLRGRTKTIPVGEVDHLRFAVVSCSNYEHGYFNAYKHLAQRNDLDAILHLGDYIYEYEVGGYSAFLEDRQNQPVNEILTLEDYRARHSHYKLDPDLMRVHQQHPFITIWDDHEFANNAWFGGAQNHQDWEGDWFERKLHAWQSYFEWMPVRDQENYMVRKTFDFGGLAKIYFLDTRVEGRDEQLNPGSSDLDSPDRTLLGEAQKEWLADEIEESEAQWNIFAQQVMMAPLTAFGIELNTDQWDGYQADRNWLYDQVIENSLSNFIVLTGDIHTAWVNNLPTENYNEDAQIGSIGIEFVCTSVTSAALGFDISDVLISLLNPHIKYSDLENKGYMLLDVTVEGIQAQWMYMNSVETSGLGEFIGASYSADDNVHFASIATQAILEEEGECDFAPDWPWFLTTSISEMEAPILLGAYPNPSSSGFTVQFALQTSSEVLAELFDSQGKLVVAENWGTLPVGLHYARWDAKHKAGLYILRLQTAAGQREIRLVVE